MRPRLAVAVLMSLVLKGCTGSDGLIGPVAEVASGPSFSHGGDSPVATQLTWTGATAFSTADASVTLAAQLTWSGGGVAGADVTLTLYSGQGMPLGDCVVPTDANGTAQCSVPATLSAGYVFLMAQYSGDATHLGAMASALGTVAEPAPPPPPPPPQAAMPTTADDCRRGGWQAYGVFRNQGDCVSYVATGGRNLPAEQ